MSFAIWQQHPPFKFAKENPEQIYQVGAVWVVTDDPARATQANVDAVLNVPPPVQDPVITKSQLQAALDAAGIAPVQVSAAMDAVVAK